MDSRTLHCASCSTPLPEAAQFCFACGTPVSPQPNASLSSSSADTAAALQRALGGEYLVGPMLGQGGFAQVFAATELKLKREVAVKVLRPELGFSEATLERFRREAEAIAVLRHPQVVPIFAVGERAGVAFIIMPLIRGETLRARMEREGPLSVPEALRILTEVASALEAAHEIGLIHRDIKPENIMLEGRERRALLMDFGIAKPVAPGSATLTETGLAVGTPGYMSPEQAVGDRSVDHRADQYGLGAVGYEMLAGRLPFVEESSRQVLHRQMTTTPRRLDAVADVPPPLASIIARALRADPAERFGSVAEMLAHLRAVDLPVEESAERSEHVASLSAPPLRWLALAGVLGVLLYLLLYRSNHPEVGTFSGVRRAAAESVATALFATEGAVGAYRRTAGLNLISSDRAPVREGRGVVMDALGPGAAARWSRTRFPFWAFAIQWVDPEGAVRWEASVALDQRVVAFRRLTPAPDQRVPQSPDSAAAAARSFLANVGLATEPMVLTGQRTLDEGAGQEFVWEEPGDSGVQGIPGVLRDAVTVADGRVRRFRRYLHPRESEAVSFGPQAYAQAAAFVVLLGASLVLLFTSRARAASGQLREREVLVLAGVVAAVEVLGQCNALPRMRNEGASLGEALFQIGGPGVYVGIYLILLGLVGEYLARRAFPAVLDGVVPLLRGEIVRGPAVTACLAGTALGLSALGVRALGDLLARTMEPGWRPEFDAVYAHYNRWFPSAELLPWAITNTALQGITLLASVAIVYRCSGRQWAALLGGVIFAACLRWPVQASLATSVLLGAFWCWALLRLGLLASLVGIFVSLVADRGLEVVTSGAEQANRVALAMLFLLLMPAGTGWWLRRDSRGLVMNGVRPP